MRRAEINVTPLVDVALVLLIIFMFVSGNAVNRAREVPLPGAAHAQGDESAAALYIAVTSDGIYWDREPIASAAAVAARLALPENKRRHVLVSADADLSYGDVYPVLIALHEGGVGSTALATRSDR
jgi:biopolymer transport protein ExbD